MVALALVSQLHLSPEFQQQLREALPEDKTFRKVYREIKERPNGELHNFTLDRETELLYMRDEGRARLCVPGKLIPTFCRMAHDHRAHVRTNRAYSFLRQNTFFHDMKRTLNSYIKACPECRKADPGKAYGDLHPLEIPKIPLSTLCLDFMVGLPLSREGNDMILVITDKTSQVHTDTGREEHLGHRGMGRRLCTPCVP